MLQVVSFFARVCFFLAVAEVGAFGGSVATGGKSNVMMMTLDVDDICPQVLLKRFLAERRKLGHEFQKEFKASDLNHLDGTVGRLEQSWCKV